MSFTITQRDALRNVRDRLADLRRQRHDIEQTVADARQAVQDRQPVNGESAESVARSPEFVRADQALRDLNALKERIGSAEGEERYLLGRMAGVGLHQETVLHDPMALDQLRMLSESSQPIGDRIVGPVQSRDEFLDRCAQRRAAVMGDGWGGRSMAAAGDVTLPSDAARTQFYGVIPPLLRQLRILDLINTQPMDVGEFSYLQTAFTSGAAETTELSVKPSASVTTTDATCKAVTIPVWVGAARQVLADVPGLTNTLEDLLRWDVEQRLESEILAGGGSGANMTGILNVSGIGAPASGPGDSVNADLVANAINTVRVSNADPNGVVMNPTDVTKAVKVKASGSGERLDSDGAFGSAPTTMFGLPLIQSNAIAAGTALVGDWTRGATLFVREGLTVRVSDADQADFVNNRIKILVEGRWGLATWRPTCFAKATLSFAN